MTTTYRTVATKLAPTPLGLLPERWTIEHWCNTCRQRVLPDQLLAHAQRHDHHRATAKPSPVNLTSPKAAIHPEGGTIE